MVTGGVEPGVWEIWEACLWIGTRGWASRCVFRLAQLGSNGSDGP